MHFFIPEGKSFDSPEEDLSPGTTGSLLEGVTEPIHKIFVEKEDLGDFLALTDIEGKTTNSKSLSVPDFKQFKGPKTQLWCRASEKTPQRKVRSHYKPQNDSRSQTVC